MSRFLARRIARSLEVEDPSDHSKSAEDRGLRRFTSSRRIEPPAQGAMLFRGAEHDGDIAGIQGCLGPGVVEEGPVGSLDGENGHPGSVFQT